MKLGNLIQESGFVAKDFPRLSEIQVNLLDRKNRTIQTDLHFEKEIFDKFPNSKRKFREFLENEKKELLPECIKGRLTDDALVLYWPGGTQFFLRC